MSAEPFTRHLVRFLKSVLLIDEHGAPLHPATEEPEAPSMPMNKARFSAVHRHALALISTLIDGCILHSVRIRRVGPVETPEPRRAHPDDAGLDLPAAIRSGIRCRDPFGNAEVDAYFCDDVPELVIEDGGSAIIPTGWSFEIPHGFEGQVRGRSGLTERRIYVPTATIDAGYCGELHVQVHNMSSQDFHVRTGDLIAQLVIAPVALARPEVAVDELPETVRGANGFGSTDTAS